MISYFTLDTMSIGPLRIQVWGMMVVIGALVGWLVAWHEARRVKLDIDLLLDLVVWALVPALIFGRLGYAFFYNWAATIADPRSIYRLWEGGMSSFGGYLGVALGILLFGWWRHWSGRRVKLRPYIEVLAYVAPLAYGIGRIGCFLIHDHPGVLNNSFLAVVYPAGARLDHGLLLLLFGFLIFVVFYFLKWRGHQLGADRWFYLPLLLLIYGTGRLFLDFWRAWDLLTSDVRYWYLAPSQYGALLMIVGGIFIFTTRGKHRRK